LIYLEDYIREHGDPDEIDPDDAAQWIVSHDLYKRPMPTPQQIVRRALSRAMRAHYYTDPQNRDVRVRHRVRLPDGRDLWYDIRTAKPEPMKASFQLRRNGLLDDAKQHDLDFTSYNDNNPHGAKLKPIDYDLNPDIEESRHPTDYPDDRPPEEPPPTPH
jgi:hypothetical protein